jgi:microcystin-dependent protein
MSDPFIGEIRMAGFNFAPVGWALCQGQLLSIAQNSALFALLGTQFGGNGQTTFGLPDLRGRLPIHYGQGPGLSPRSMGELFGEEQVILLPAQMPGHSHGLVAATDGERRDSPAGNLLASGEADLYSRAGADPVAMAGTAIGAAGGSQPHGNLQPYLCLNFIIALEGIFPPRN